jgi:uncharacterized membrane protein
LEAQQPPFPVVRSGLPLSAPFDWLRRGAADLRTCGFASLFYGLCFAGTGILLLLAFRHAVQLVTAVTTGFMLVGPFFAIGLYELSRRREAGEALDLAATLAVWRRNLAAIGIYSLILIVLYLVWGARLAGHVRAVLPGRHADPGKLHGADPAVRQPSNSCWPTWWSAPSLRRWYLPFRWSRFP